MAPPVKRTVRTTSPLKAALQPIANPKPAETVVVVEDERTVADRRVAPAPRRAVPRTSPAARAEVLQRVIPIINANARREGDDPPDKTDYHGIMRKYNEKINNRKSAIRAFCVTCSNGSLAEVRWCTVKKCALWPFRLGADPFNLKSIKADAARRGQPIDDDVEEEET